MPAAAHLGEGFVPSIGIRRPTAETRPGNFAILGISSSTYITAFYSGGEASRLLTPQARWPTTRDWGIPRGREVPRGRRLPAHLFVHTCYLDAVHPGGEQLEDMGYA
jgi:hypothetical protein